MAKKKIAGLTTVWRPGSHADAILGKVLDGYLQDGGPGPDLELASLYVDQVGEHDMSRDLARKHGFRLSRSIADALTLGTDKLAVEGVLLIAEHGNYPVNPREQTLYPRRRFFDETARVFAKSGRAVPVFNDKHLAATWDDARWIYDRARELYVPFMAGSSLPVMWRKPAEKLPLGCELLDAVAIGYGPYEGYGIHALEALQCMVERRKGGESGVRAVTNVPASEMWKRLDAGDWSKATLEAAMAVVPAHAKGDVRQLTEKREGGVMLIEYRDGLRAAVAMLNGWCYDGAFSFAARVRGRERPFAVNFIGQENPPYAHFAYLLRAIDTMMRTGHAAYPVERTLLTTGVMDAIMTSRTDHGKRLETPHLGIAYQPVDWPFATDPMPPERKRG